MSVLQNIGTSIAFWGKGKFFNKFIIKEIPWDKHDFKKSKHS